MLFHVFIYYITSLQIFHFYEFFCTNISQVELEILRNFSTIFRSSHQRCSRKKVILKYFVIFTGKHLCRGLFFNVVAGHQACNFIKKRLHHRYFLANFGGNLEEHLFWRTFANSCIVGKCLVRTFFRLELSKRNYWWLAVWNVAQISSYWTKMLPIIKY